MEAFICLFCPAAVVLLIYEGLAKKKLDIKSSICVFLLFTLIINVFATLICRFLFGIIDSMSDAIYNSPIFAIKYVIVAMVIAVIVAIISAWISKNVKVEMLIKKEAKNAKTKKASKN